MELNLIILAAEILIVLFTNLNKLTVVLDFKVCFPT